MYLREENDKRPYRVCISKGFIPLQEEITRKYQPSSMMVISDSEVAKYYLEDVCHALNCIAPTYTYTFEHGEKSKHLETIKRIYDAMIAAKMDRESLLIALGGGVTGDMVGFAAATYMRGIPFVQVPTTILAQNDSSIGGKVGIDYCMHKNMIGAFYQPMLVYANIETLKTLPNREFSSGMAEVIKHALIKDKSLFETLLTVGGMCLKSNLNQLEQITYRSSSIKCTIVEEDPKEKTSRKLLNFGHTIGHAIETLSHFELLHGECVAYGMCMSAYISHKRGFLSSCELERIIMLNKQFELLLPLPHFDIKEVIHQMQYDKKKAYGKISFILLKQIGQGIIVTDITTSEIEDAFAFIKKTCA